MNSLYKRITTLGMVSVTAILAWIYCVLEYRDEPVYIVGISLVLIISIYALLNAIISLRIDKDNKLKNHIDSTIASAIAGMEQSKSLEDMERLSKAMYIQLRKVNTTLSASTEDSSSKLNEEMNQTVVEAINKAVKIIVKYNQNNHEGMVLALSDLSTELSKISEELNQVKLQDNTDNIAAIDDADNSYNADFANSIYDNESYGTDNGTVIPFPNDSKNEFENTATDTSVNKISDSDMTVNDISNSNMAINDILGSNTSVNDMSGSNTAVNDMSDSNMAVNDMSDSNAAVNDMSGNNTAATTSSVNDDTNNTYDFGIPKTEESPASEAPSLDENRTLTPDEIAALFASAMGDNSKN